MWYHDKPGQQPGISAAELEEIARIAALQRHSGVPWRQLLRQPQLWLIFIMYWCYAWGSWFYFGWFPVYLVKALDSRNRKWESSPRCHSYAARPEIWLEVCLAIACQFASGSKSDEAWWAP